MKRSFRTALVGVGRIGAAYSDDPLLARHYRYSSHAQVIATHPAFEWGAALDSDAAALANTQARWGFTHAVLTVAELHERYSPEVLVLAIPPSGRSAIVQGCPGVKAVLCEKPLDIDLSKAGFFLDLCRERGAALVQVNYWRRCDDLYRRLANGSLESLIGRPQAIQGIYGNGLFNNGAHLIDTCRMLVGEIESVRALGSAKRHHKLPIVDDFDVGCHINFARGFSATLLPIDFVNYRENSLIFWGEQGRLELMNEDLTINLYKRNPHRAVAGAQEIAADAPERLSATVSDALYRVYDNLAAALRGEQGLMSSGESAWQTALVLDAIRRSVEFGDVCSVAVEDQRSSL
jgi:predicted dehydrogenase